MSIAPVDSSSTGLVPALIHIVTVFWISIHTVLFQFTAHHCKESEYIDLCCTALTNEKQKVEAILQNLYLDNKCLF